MQVYQINGWWRPSLDAACGAVHLLSARRPKYWSGGMGRYLMRFKRVMAAWLSAELASGFLARSSSRHLLTLHVLTIILPH